MYRHEERRGDAGVIGLRRDAWNGGPYDRVPKKKEEYSGTPVAESKLK